MRHSLLLKLQTFLIIFNVLFLPSSHGLISNTSFSRKSTLLFQSESSPSSSSSSTQQQRQQGQQGQQRQQLYIDLTPQERILKEALGIEPETPAEKEKRVTERVAKQQRLQNEKRRNLAFAISSVVAACMSYYWQYTHPVTSLSLLTDMQQKSDDITLIGKNGKPTVVDFWAPWCGNCKSAAPTMAMIEAEYRNRVNFVMVNGDVGDNWPLIERFGVDAIPHIAMVGSDGYVETALIGPIPVSVLRADLDAMIENSNRRSTVVQSNSNTIGDQAQIDKGQQQAPGKIDLPYTIQAQVDKGQQQAPVKLELPYTMYDAFSNNPDLRKISF